MPGRLRAPCTVNVVGAKTGAVSNGADQLTTVRLRKPAKPATLTVGEPTSPSSVAPACSDGSDNDGDGKIDRQDSGCVLAGVYLPRKNSEDSIAPLAQCARSSGKRVATAAVRGDLSFGTTASLPAKAIWSTNAARYQARLGKQRSLRLRFARRMTDTVARRLDPARVQIGGPVTGPLVRPLATVLVRASSRCPGSSFRGSVAARGIRVQPSGRWSATITLPASLRGSRVFLRAETRARKTTRNLKRFRTFTWSRGSG